MENKTVTIEKLKAGREQMRQRCYETALVNTPPNVRIIEIRKSLSGYAFLALGRMAVPVPKTRKSLYIFLHECAHFALGHVGHRKPVHVMEMEAEKWAHEKMRASGIQVPRSMTKRAKAYVARKIRQAERRGAKHIDSCAKAFAGSQRNEH